MSFACNSLQFSSVNIINMIYIIVFSVITGALGLYYFLFKNLNHFKKHGIPYVTPLPVVGNMGSTFIGRQSGADLVQSIYNVHPTAKYVGMYDMTRPMLVLRDPELIKSVAVKHFDMFPDHGVFVEETQDKIVGKNLFFLRGDRWREIRSILTPTFTSSKMKNMFRLMSDCGIDFSDYLAQLPSEKKIMDMKDIFTKYATDVIATCAFGFNINCMRNPENEFYVFSKQTSIFDIWSLFKFYVFRNLPWLARLINMKFYPTKVEAFFRDIVKTTIKTRAENGIVRPDMLQLMMESKDNDGKMKLSLDDMVAQAFNFFIGGFDSSSTLMCFAAHEIAVNRNVQKRLQDEIDQILNNANVQVSYEAINGMEYLDAVINEALRMYPVGVALDRLCVQDFELPPALPELKPYIIKNGQSIWIPVYALHHDSQYFEEPEKFDPERFLGERKQTTLNCGAYFPFGAGPRMCIGNRFALLETKILLFHLLARCDLKSCEKTSIPLKMAKDGFNMKPEGGFWLSITPRENMHDTIASGFV